jgi:hypothetical protein
VENTFFFSVSVPVFLLTSSRHLPTAA